MSLRENFKEGLEEAPYGFPLGMGILVANPNISFGRFMLAFSVIVVLRMILDVLRWIAKRKLPQ